MRRLWFAVGIICLLTWFGGCLGSAKKEHKVLVGHGAGQGEQPVSKNDFDLPSEPSPELVGFFNHFDFMKEGRFALRVPYGIKKLSMQDGQIFVQAHDNQIWAIDADTLIVDWKWPNIVGEWAYPPTVNAFGAYFVSRDRMYSIDRSEGFERWRYDLPFASSSPPTAADYYIFMGSWDGRIYCISDDVRAASIAWYHQVGREITCPPMKANILRNTWVHVNSSDGHYKKFRPNRLQSNPHSKIFQFEKGSEGPMAHNDELAFIASPDYNVYAVHPLEGPRWVYLSQSRFHDGCRLQDDNLYARNEETFVALDAATGKVLWKNDKLAEFIVKLKRYSYFRTTDGHLVGLDNNTIRSSGEISWLQDVSEFDYIIPSAERARLYMATKSGYIITFEEEF